jgi:hypothetical protein
MHPVIATCRGEQNGWIGSPWLRGMIGRELAQERPILRFVRIAIFGDSTLS